MNAELYRLMLNASKDYLSLIDTNYVYVEVNDAYLHARKLERSKVIGHTVSEVWGEKAFGEFIKEKLDQAFKGKSVSYQSVFEFEEDRVNYMDVTFLPVRDSMGRVTHCAVVSHNLTEIKQSEEKIKHLEYYDLLTGLPNRLQFLDRLTLEIAHARRRKSSLAVLMLDLDLFKTVNDTMGHTAGDLLLKEASLRLKKALRESDTVTRLGSHVKFSRGSLSRFGGDEFALIIPNLSQPDDATAVAKRLQASFRNPFGVKGKSIFTTCCIGLSIYPDDADEIDNLVRNADAALHKAKDSGRDSIQFFSREMNQEAVRRLEIENALYRAIENDEFSLHYQPQFELENRRIVAVEALLRWTHPYLGDISPLDFIHLAERSGYIIQIGEWVLGQASRDLAQIHRKYGPHVRMSVNLSARQFADERLIETVKNALARYRIDHSLLELEITESSMMNDIERTIQILNELKALKIAIALDDFGTGYSSLRYLRQFPIDTLKIDREFIRDISLSNNDSAIVRGIIMMARELELKVIAEGVETEEDVRFLARHGCHLAQGFYLCEPLPIEQLPPPA